MAKENQTFEQILAAAELPAELKKAIGDAHISATSALVGEITTLGTTITDRDTTIATLTEELAALTTEQMKLTGIVPGTYTSKKTKQTYAFRKGVLKFDFKAEGKTASQKYDSAEVLKDPVIMEQLIAIGAGFLEEVEE